MQSRTIELKGANIDPSSAIACYTRGPNATRECVKDAAVKDTRGPLHESKQSILHHFSHKAMRDSLGISAYISFFCETAIPEG